MIEQKKGFRIFGKVVVRETGKGVPKVIVEALDKDLIFDDRLGSVITDKDGNFEIPYEREDFQELFFDLKPDIYLRVRRPDGKVIHTTEDKVRYGAGKTEAFYVKIPKSKVEEEEMEKEQLTDYSIKGKIDPGNLKKISGEVPILAYAVRDRRVLGSAPIQRDGSFEIKYQYKAFGKDKEPYGVDLIIGPELPSHQIPKMKFERIFLSSKGFKSASPKYEYVIEDTIKVSDWVVDYIKNIYEEWCPCIRVVTCSSLDYSTLGYPICHDETPLNLPNVYVRISEVWGTRTWFFEPWKYSSKPLIEGKVDEFGYFKKCIQVKKITMSLLLGPTLLGYMVEVYQVMGGEQHTLYKDDIENPRSRWTAFDPGYDLLSNACVTVHVDKSEVDIYEPELADPPIPGRAFRFSRVRNIEREYIDDQGRANTISAPPDSPTLKGVYDSAFSGTLHLYANIGEDLLDDTTRESEVKYFRIKYTYFDGVTDQTGYITRRFLNPRYDHLPDGSVGDPIYEDMGPLPLTDTGGKEGFYKYPNPHERIDLHPDCDWYYKELIMVLSTHALPSDCALYNFELELFDQSKNDITSTIIDPDGTGLGLKLLVDNTPPTGSIGDIMGPGNQVAEACGFLHLPYGGSRIQECYGSTNTRIHSSNAEITVPFSAQDLHGNLHSVHLVAHWGCNESKVLVGCDAGGCYNPQTSDGTQEYRAYTQVPVSERPTWNGRNDFSKSKTRQWDQCAYQFRLKIYKRVTNGVDPHTIEPEFTKHITILVDQPSP